MFLVQQRAKSLLAPDSYLKEAQILNIWHYPIRVTIIVHQTVPLPGLNIVQTLFYILRLYVHTIVGHRLKHAFLSLLASKMTSRYTSCLQNKLLFLGSAAAATVMQPKSLQWSPSMSPKNPTIFNIIRWLAGSMRQMNRWPSIPVYKTNFFLGSATATCNQSISSKVLRWTLFSTEGPPIYVVFTTTNPTTAVFYAFLSLLASKVTSRYTSCLQNKFLFLGSTAAAATVMQPKSLK